ncbi:hypothetical protein [Mesorhizobium sp.]|uniref:hypothetical protein n=1 Tax=Mesorhizobium sp. TaxID=1871066 RepID=UPI0026007E2E|nr:hypothetical protein [Mesorhizobium sp.]
MLDILAARSCGFSTLGPIQPAIPHIISSLGARIRDAVYDECIKHLVADEPDRERKPPRWFKAGLDRFDQALPVLSEVPPTVAAGDGSSCRCVMDRQQECRPDAI